MRVALTIPATDGELLVAPIDLWECLDQTFRQLGAFAQKTRDRRLS